MTFSRNITRVSAIIVFLLLICLFFVSQNNQVTKLKTFPQILSLNRLYTESILLKDETRQLNISKFSQKIQPVFVNSTLETLFDRNQKSLFELESLLTDGIAVGKLRMERLKIFCASETYLNHKKASVGSKVIAHFSSYGVYECIVPKSGLFLL